MDCCNCYSPLLAPDEDGWRKCPRGCGFFFDTEQGTFTHDDLTAERVEDEAQLLDLSEYRLDRSFGG